MSFTFNIREKSPLVIALYGELVDRDESRELLNMVQESCDEGHTHFIFDLSELRVMNSTGLNVLINSLTLARKAGGDVFICCVSDKIKMLFIITKLNTIFQVFDTDVEAIEAFNVSSERNGNGRKEDEA